MNICLPAPTQNQVTKGLRSNIDSYFIEAAESRRKEKEQVEIGNHSGWEVGRNRRRFLALCLQYLREEASMKFKKKVIF